MRIVPFSFISLASPTAETPGVLPEIQPLRRSKEPPLGVCTSVPMALVPEAVWLLKMVFSAGSQFITSVPALYTPPPQLYVAVLSEIVPPYRLKVPSLFTPAPVGAVLPGEAAAVHIEGAMVSHTAPLLPVTVNPVRLPLYRLKMPSENTSTPQPFTPLV